MSYLFFALLSTAASSAHNDRLGMPLQDVVAIARGIHSVQPHLSNEKYLQYALGIHRAATRFQIEPSLLIAIAQQESGFRENLPEGKAGEIGICQILKHWRSNPNFQEVFGNVSIADIQRPANSFLYSAWILSELRKDATQGRLPFWSFYNSTRFSNRLKYFVRVNKKLTTLRKNSPEIFQLAMLSGFEKDQPVQAKKTTTIAASEPKRSLSSDSAIDLARSLTRTAAFGESLILKD